MMVRHASGDRDWLLTMDEDETRGRLLDRRLVVYGREVLTYWREARRLRDFLSVMKVRLSQSKVGPIVCPVPVIVDVDLRSLGRSVRLRSHTTDISVLGELLVGGSYAGVAGRAARVATILDLGANTGLAARWLHHQFPNSEIICVEPEPENFSVLKYNLQQVPNAQAFQVCIAGHARKVSLATTTGEHGYAMVDDDSAEIDAITMDELLSRASVERVDLLKCDIEGAEQEVFASCPWAREIELAVVECHGAYRTSDLLNDLRRSNARMRVLSVARAEGFDCEVASLERTR
jgi:FkbM family methyltransferase